MLSQPSYSPSYANLKACAKTTLLSTALLAALGLGPAIAAGQTRSDSGAGVSRTARAVTYRNGDWKVSFRGTDLMPRATGEAQVENKGNRVEIEAKFQAMDEANKFGFEYLTYVLWAVSPQ